MAFGLFGNNNNFNLGFPTAPLISLACSVFGFWFLVRGKSRKSEREPVKITSDLILQCFPDAGYQCGRKLEMLYYVAYSACVRDCDWQDNVSLDRWEYLIFLFDLSSDGGQQVFHFIIYKYIIIFEI